MTRKTLTALAVTAVVVAAGTTPASAGSKLSWAPCAGEELAGLECTAVGVPMDYGDSDGTQLTIALSRHKATDPKNRRGVLFTNPGGPGGEGRWLPLRYADQPIAAVYDIIGIDVRGVGGSTQLACDVSGIAGGVTETTRPSDEDFPRISQLYRQLEDGCRRGGGEFRPQVTTMNTARDLDRIRLALGERRINYLGVSYGTWLGAVYGQLFPGRLDRSVLDSSLDPGTTWHRQAYDSVASIKFNFDSWAEWTAARDETFGLGTTAGSVRAAVDRVATALATKPVAGLKDQNEYDVAVGEATRYRQLWAPFAKNLSKLVAVAEGAPRDDALARSNSRAAAAAARLAAPPAFNGVFQAVTCEWEWPTDLDVYYRDMRRVRDAFPYGNTVQQVSPTNCAFRAGPPAPLVHIGPARYPKGLVLAGDGDIQTAHVDGEAMAATLGSALISVRNEGQHGQYAAASGDPSLPVRANACVDDKVNAYLVRGTLPPARTWCDTVNPPTSIPADTKPAELDRLIPDLGELIEQLLAAVQASSGR